MTTLVSPMGGGKDKKDQVKSSATVTAVVTATQKFIIEIVILEELFIK